MSDVPSDVCREILLRLPAEPLLRFRTVCKEWRRIIDDPSFIRAHTNNQLSSNTLLIRNETGAPLYSFSLDSLNFTDGHQKIQVIPLKQLIRPNVPRLPLLPVAACNGLILISHRNTKKTWAIWNPFTQECRELPQLNTDLQFLGSGIGYDYVADDYKVVRIDRIWHDWVRVYQTHVYSLKLYSWRLIEDSSCDFSCLRGPGVFLNGALHWRAGDVVIAFDLRTEKYCQFPLPPPATTISLDTIPMYLDALSGCLILSYFNFKIQRFDGWVMKDYGAKDSWMKLFSFEEPEIIDIAEILRPVAYFNNKKQVLLQHGGGFFWFDVESNSVKKVSIHGLPDISSSQICPGSLFRFHDHCRVSGSVAAKRTGAKRKRERNMAADTRLTFCVRDIDVPSCSHDSCCSSD